MPGEHPFLFTRHHVRNETEESDATKGLELMLVRSLELWVDLKSPIVSYTPSGATLQLWILGATLPARRARAWEIWFRDAIGSSTFSNGTYGCLTHHI